MGEELIELKFRIYDGTDIAHSTYASSMTVANLKQKIVAEWPRDKTIAPKSVKDLKLIHAGKVLENNKTLADSRITIGDLPAGFIIMHVILAESMTYRSVYEAPNLIPATYISGKRNKSSGNKVAVRLVEKLEIEQDKDFLMFPASVTRPLRLTLPHPISLSLSTLSFVLPKQRWGFKGFLI
ncbi:hypothetical protein V6N12_054007 [Hibiscus sabdariffa]|uniref:Ubiquitin-like domain-containing protein n=1 Tax=Hibiscus sabdariffa TaxID=183260 RepID=A0ABR2DA58_9ROSI